jgi:hypothetical protein
MTWGRDLKFWQMNSAKIAGESVFIRRQEIGTTDFHIYCVTRVAAIVPLLPLQTSKHFFPSYFKETDKQGCTNVFWSTSIPRGMAKRCNDSRDP